MGRELCLEAPPAQRGAALPPLLLIAVAPGGREPAPAAAVLALASIHAALRPRGLRTAPLYDVRFARLDASGDLWSGTMDVGRVRLRASAAGPPAQDGGVGGRVRAALTRMLHVALAWHLAALPAGEGALPGFGAPVPLFTLTPQPLPAGPLCAAAEAAGLPSTACAIWVSPSAVWLLQQGQTMLLPGCAPGVALAAVCGVMGGQPLAVDVEFAQPQRALDSGVAAWPLAAARFHAGAAVLQLAASHVPPLVVSLGPYLEGVARASDGRAFCVRRPARPVPRIVRDLLAARGHARFVVGPTNDLGELPRALVDYDASDPLQWAINCDDELRRVTRGWVDIAAAAHPCLGARPSLATLSRHVLGLSLDGAKALDQRGRWDVSDLSPSQVRYAAGDAAATLLCALRLLEAPAPCSCLVAVSDVHSAPVERVYLPEEAAPRPPRAGGSLPVPAPAGASALPDAGGWAPFRNSLGEPVALNLAGFEALAAEGGLVIPESVRRILDTGYQFLSDEPIVARVRIYDNYKSITDSPHREAMGALQDDWVRRGIAERLEVRQSAPGDVVVINPLGAVDKSTPPFFRMVFDGTRSGLNGQLRTLGVSLPAMEKILGLLMAGAAVAKFDGREWFYQILVDRRCRSLQAYHHAVRQEVHRLRMMAMGTRPATEAAQLVSECFARILCVVIAKRLSAMLGFEVAADLRALDRRWDAAPPSGPCFGALVWVDDFLCWAWPLSLMSHAEALRDDVCEVAHLQFGKEDGFGTPTTTVPYTGFDVHTAPSVRMELPAAKRSKYSAMLCAVLLELEENGAVSFGAAEKLAGVLEHVGHATAWAQLYSWQLASAVGAGRAHDARVLCLDTQVVDVLRAFWQPLLAGPGPIVRSQWRNGGVADAPGAVVLCRVAAGGALGAFAGDAVVLRFPLPADTPRHPAARGARALRLLLERCEHRVAGLRVCAELTDAVLVAAVNEPRSCPGGASSLLSLEVAGLAAVCMRLDVDLRARLPPAAAAPMVPRRHTVAHRFLRAADFSVAGGVHASVEVFGVAQRRSPALQLVHLASAGAPGPAVFAAAQGKHVWCFPPFDAAIIAAALNFGRDLLRESHGTIYTVVVPAWPERGWWRKLIAAPTRSGGERFPAVYTTLETFPPQCPVLQHLFAKRGRRPLVTGVSFPLVVVRLSARYTASFR